MSQIIYKILTSTEWAEAQAGPFAGAPVDVHDGYIHFSTAEQVRETATKHFAGQAGLWLISYETARLSPALKWERSRGGALFPHLYRVLEPGDEEEAVPLPLSADGAHQFPQDVP